MGAACIPGSKAEVMEDLDSSAKEDSGFMGSHLKQIKQWLLSHSQHLNFFTILVLALVIIVIVVLFVLVVQKRSSWKCYFHFLCFCWMLFPILDLHCHIFSNWYCVFMFLVCTSLGSVFSRVPHCFLAKKYLAFLFPFSISYIFFYNIYIWLTGYRMWIKLATFKWFCLFSACKLALLFLLLKSVCHIKVKTIYIS